MFRPPKWSTVIEGATALIISIAAVFSSWTGFQASLWDGEQAAHYAQAEAARTAAAKLTTISTAFETADLLMFQQWLNATARRETTLQTFYRQRFRPEFVPAFEAWLRRDPLVNTNAPPTPFHMPQHRSARAAMAHDLEREANRLFARGQRDNDISDHFGRVAMFLAVALFFGGISQSFKSLWVKTALVAMATAVCVLCALQVHGLPVMTLS